MLHRRSSARERQLAGDERAGRWTRAKARTQQRAFVKKHWRLVTGLAVGTLGLAGIVSLLMPNDFMRGVLAGGGLATTVAAVYFFVLLLSGTAPTMMGDLAEQWTSQELQPLRAHGWRLINHFGLTKGDQDHVLIGPGGLVLLETKWSASDWRLKNDRRIDSARAQLERNARSLQGWVSSRADTVNVQRVLVLWGEVGSELEHSPSGKRHDDGTLVIRGRHLQQWALRLGRAGLTEEQSKSLWQAMDQHLVGRDAFEEAMHPLPASLAEIARLIFASVVTGFGSFLVVIKLTELTPSTWWGLPMSIATVGCGALTRRWVRFRPIGTALIAGGLCWPLLVGAAVLVGWLS